MGPSEQIQAEAEAEAETEAEAMSKGDNKCPQDTPTL
jgi:hypothetical protein